MGSHSITWLSLVLGRVALCAQIQPSVENSVKLHTHNPRMIILEDDRETALAQS